jgi:hypothetical protein
MATIAIAPTPKGDPRKVKLAVRLRVETTATIKWIAERLQMGSADGQLDACQSSAILAPEEIEMTTGGKYYKTRNRPLSGTNLSTMSGISNLKNLL